MCVSVLRVVTSLFIYDLSEQFRGHRHSKHRDAFVKVCNESNSSVLYLYTQIRRQNIVNSVYSTYYFFQKGKYDMISSFIVT